jgi:hypothetical protein
MSLDHFVLVRFAEDSTGAFMQLLINEIPAQAQFSVRLDLPRAHSHASATVQSFLETVHGSLGTMAPISFRSESRTCTCKIGWGSLRWTGKGSCISKRYLETICSSL